jgi:hypothetical protein
MPHLAAAAGTHQQGRQPANWSHPAQAHLRVRLHFHLFWKAGTQAMAALELPPISVWANPRGGD